MSEENVRIDGGVEAVVPAVLTLNASRVERVMVEGFSVNGCSLPKRAGCKSLNGGRLAQPSPHILDFRFVLHGYNMGMAGPGHLI